MQPEERDAALLWDMADSSPPRAFQQPLYSWDAARPATSKSRVSLAR